MVMELIMLLITIITITIIWKDGGDIIKLFMMAIIWSTVDPFKSPPLQSDHILPVPH